MQKEREEKDWIDRRCLLDCSHLCLARIELAKLIPILRMGRGDLTESAGDKEPLDFWAFDGHGLVNNTTVTLTAIAVTTATLSCYYCFGSQGKYMPAVLRYRPLLSRPLLDVAWYRPVVFTVRHPDHVLFADRSASVSGCGPSLYHAIKIADVSQQKQRRVVAQTESRFDDRIFSHNTSWGQLGYSSQNLPRLAVRKKSFAFWYDMKRLLDCGILFCLLPFADYARPPFANTGHEYI